MTKEEAIKEFVARDLNAVPQEWVQIINEHSGTWHALPMWGTMWIVDNFIGESLMEHSRVMADSPEDINLEDIEDEEKRAKVKAEVEKTDPDWSVLEEYIDEEMSGERCVLDKNGNTTALYIYEIAGEYVIGVNGAGWNFYDGVWDRLYDLLDLKWHEQEA